VAEKKLDEPKQVHVVGAFPNKATIGKKYKKEAARIFTALQELTEDEVLRMEVAALETETFSLKISDGNEGYTTVELNKDMMEVKRFEKTLHVEEITPSVIEPSFGIGRIMYATLEHAFRQRDGDEKRVYLELPPSIAPIKCSILPISANTRLDPIIEAVSEQLAEYDLSQKIDNSSGSIGRRYARTDEIGIPFGITVDFESEQEPWTVTLRHAPSMHKFDSR